MTAHRVLVAIAAAVALAACGGTTTVGEGPDELRPLLAGSWQLIEGTAPDGPLSLVASHPVSLAFDDTEDTLGGTVCNSYGGQFTLDGQRIAISELMATEMACFPEEVMDLERAYLAALLAVDTATVDGDRLVLTGEGVELLFERLPEAGDRALVGTTWVLDTLIDGDAASSIPDTDGAVTLELAEDGTFEAFTGCNTLTGSFTVQGDGLELSAGAITDAACPDLGALQDRILALLDGRVETDVRGSRLTLTGPDGDGLSYRAES